MIFLVTFARGEGIIVRKILRLRGLETDDFLIVGREVYLTGLAHNPLLVARLRAAVGNGLAAYHDARPIRASEIKRGTKIYKVRYLRATAVLIELAFVGMAVAFILSRIV